MSHLRISVSLLLVSPLFLGSGGGCQFKFGILDYTTYPRQAKLRASMFVSAACYFVRKYYNYLQLEIPAKLNMSLSVNKI